MMLLAVLPLGHAPQAKTAAVIGIGSGMSTALLLASPNLTRVDSIEIEPAIIEGARNFQPVVDPAYKDPRSHIVIDDAKSYFARGRQRYDIVSEPSNPWVSGRGVALHRGVLQAPRGVAERRRRSLPMAPYLRDGFAHARVDPRRAAEDLPHFTVGVLDHIDSDIVLVARKGGAPGRSTNRFLR